MSSVLQHPSRDLGLIIYLKNVGTSSYLGTYSKITGEDPCVALILWISFPMFLQNKLSFVFAINFYTEIKEENSLSLCFLIIFAHYLARGRGNWKASARVQKNQERKVSFEHKQINQHSYSVSLVF